MDAEKVILLNYICIGKDTLEVKIIQFEKLLKEVEALLPHKQRYIYIPK